MRHPSSSSSTPAASGGASSSKTTPCCVKVGLKRGPWTPEEDELLASYIKKEGEGRWRTLPKRAGLLRCGKSCRLRWMNYLRPCVKRGHIAPDEEDLILRLHRLLGNRWSLIAGRIPGRTDNEIKNYWNTHLSKKLINQGIDPRTHKPLDSNSPMDYDKPSSSKANQIHDMPNHNPNPVTPSLEVDPISSSRFPVINEGNGYYEGANANHMPINPNPNPNLQSCDFSGLGLRSSNGGVGNIEEDNEINYCTDDVFSSFLNSLINEDVFNNQHQVQQQLNGIVPFGSSDALIISPPQNFTLGAGWDIAPIMSSASAINHNDHVDKKF